MSNVDSRYIIDAYINYNVSMNNIQITSGVSIKVLNINKTKNMNTDYWIVYSNML